jgi:hypothetical protein
MKRFLLWLVVGALIVGDITHFPLGALLPYREFRYGETWMRVQLFTGKTTVLIAPKGWVPVTGWKLPPPEAGRDAWPASRGRDRAIEMAARAAAAR